MDKFIILLVIVLGAIAVAQLMRVSELVHKKANREPGEIPQSENLFNANLIVVFGAILFGTLIYLLVAYGYGNMGPAASTSGKAIDLLFDVQYTIVLLVIFIFMGVLFYFSRRYVRKEGVKAYYYPHINTLEMVWTVIPAAVVTIVVILGLKTWNDTFRMRGEVENIEIISYQFAWTARYAGANNKLGKFDYKLTTDLNPYGLMTRENIAASLELMKNGQPGSEGISMLEAKLNDPTIAMSAKDRKKYETELARKERMIRVLEAMSVTYNDSLDALVNDDVILADSLVLLKGQKYNLHFRSKDVIHSAYMPHFRLQMNTIPGMITYFPLQPIYTTEEMKQKTNDPTWEYALLCNKVCGGSHYKMKMSIKVLGPKEYLQWQKSKATYNGEKWVKANEQELLKYYESIAASVDKK